jgi:hypothetical protein
MDLHCRLQVTSGDEKLLNMGYAEDRLFALELGALRLQALGAAHTQKAGNGCVPCCTALCRRVCDLVCCACGALRSCEEAVD